MGSNPNATSYDIQVATDNAFANIVNSGNAITNSYSVSGLSEGTTYFWRVLPKNDTCTGVYGSPFQFTTGTISCETTASTNVPVTISASGTPTITSTLNIPSGGTISDVNITMNISHSWINDLSATLTSPTGTVVELFSNECSPNTSVNNIVATFDDSGVALVCGNNPGISGTVIPSQPLSAFNGADSTGTWTLTVSDAFNQDGGTLNSWSLAICTVEPLGAESFGLDSFVLYPNPNNGVFNLELNAQSNNVDVLVHDIRGRLILNKNFSANGLINETIELNDAQSGIYLVTVQDGARKITKKIVVE